MKYGKDGKFQVESIQVIIGQRLYVKVFSFLITGCISVVVLLQVVNCFDDLKENSHRDPAKQHKTDNKPCQHRLLSIHKPPFLLLPSQLVIDLQTDRYH